MLSDLQRIAPGFLIAAPSLTDPNFDHTVVLMCAHNEQGAMGLVINRTAPITATEIMRQLEMPADVASPQPALFGGPVSIQNALLLYEVDGQEELGKDELKVGDQLRLSPGKELLERISAGLGPQRYQIFLGHSGWAPGQLEQEIAQGAWLPASLRIDLIFTVPIEDRWEDALHKEGLHPAALGAFTPQN
jgi:putative transcriptional regulator